MSGREHEASLPLIDVEQAIEVFARGGMLVVVDEGGPEDEGTLVMPADAVDAEAVNLMASRARGVVALALTEERCQQLGLPLMEEAARGADRALPLTVSIEAAHGVSTGISAADRATTIRAAVAPHARPADLVQPGHVFPILTEPGGVLTRAGHAEAAVDLARQAGRDPSAAMVEILDAHGESARGAALAAFCRELGLGVVTVSSLIDYRMQTEMTVARVASCLLPTEYGDFTLHGYQGLLDGKLHFAMVRGAIDPDRPTLVRVHVANPICDITASLRPECGWPVRDTIRRIAEAGHGVLVIIFGQHEPADLIAQLRAYAGDGEAAALATVRRMDLRTIGVGAQILADLGVRRMRVMSRPKRLHAISGFGLEVVDYVSE